jgi:hypothetical protein
VNLSREPSQLLFERAAPGGLRAIGSRAVQPVVIDDLLAREDALGYMVPTGRYWEQIARFDAGALARLDAAWRDAWERWFAASRAA